MKYLIGLPALILGVAAIAAPAVVPTAAMASPIMARSAGFVMPQTTISRRQAQAIAVQAVGGGQAVAAHRDDFHGRPVWEVTVLNSPFEYEVTVNANNGNVLRVRKHREDD